MSNSLDDALRSAKVSKIFSVMLDKAEPDSEFKLIENGKFFVRNLLKDPDFVESLGKAKERGVKMKVLLVRPHDSYLPQKNLFDLLCGAYAFGGIENIKKYFGTSSTKDNRPVTEGEAYELAKSFEKDVLGKRKYLLRAKGIIYKILGKYETINLEGICQK